MRALLPITQIILSVLLIVVILLQQRGASLGSSFGGDSASYNTRRGLEKWLFYVTIVLAILFFISGLAAHFLQNA